MLEGLSRIDKDLIVKETLDTMPNICYSQIAVAMAIYKAAFDDYNGNCSADDVVMGVSACVYWGGYLEGVRAERQKKRKKKALQVLTHSQS